MRNEIENFISQVVLSTTYNNETGGNVEAPTGFFGTMTFDQDETDVDGITIPESLPGHTVIATQNSDGIIDYTILTEEYLTHAGMDEEDDWKAHGIFLAETWFEAISQDFDLWTGEDD